MAAEVLRQADALEGRCGDDPVCREQKAALLEQGLQKLPEDVFLHRAYQDAIRPPQLLEAARAGFQEKYKALLDAHPGEALFLYLYGQAVRSKDTEQFDLFQQALQVEPSFPWSHAGLAAHYLNRWDNAHRDEVRGQREVEAFVALCPATLAIYGYASMAEDKDFSRRNADRLRPLLERSADRATMSAFPSLWRMEFRAAPLNEYAPVRDRVRKDLDRLEATKLEGDPEWWRILAEGYQLADEAKKKDAAEDRRMQLFPCLGETIEMRMDRWDVAHPAPSYDEKSAYDAYLKALFDATGEWVLQCPRNETFWFRRLGAAENLPQLSNRDFEALVGAFFRVWESSTARLSFFPSPYTTVARAYLSRGIHLQRVADLVRKGVEEQDQRLRKRLSSGNVPEKRAAMLNNERVTTEWRSLALTAEADIGLGRLGQARDGLTKLKSLLDAENASIDEELRTQRGLLTADYWKLRARLAEKEGHRADALAFYRAAIGLQPSNKDLKAKADRVWRSLGGTDAGLAAWAALERKAPTPRTAKAATDWTKKDQPLLDFALLDLQGRSWSPDDLKGRLAVVNVWATWCGPCREELPFVQKLHERLRERPEVLLLTLNIDENPSAVEPFVKEKGYTFPVLFAEEYVRKVLADEISIPRTWLVDRDGVIRQEFIGFGPEGDPWMERVLELLASL